MELRAITKGLRVTRLAIWLAWLCAIVFSLTLLAIILVANTRPTVTRADAVLVLGAKVGTPALTERTLKGLTYYNEGKTKTIVLSGGQGPGEPVSEAEAMKLVVSDASTKTEAAPTVMLEQESTSTVENIYHAKSLVPDAQSIVLVSDEYHLARAVLIAKNAGFREVSWDAPEPGYYPTRDLIYYYLREVVAVLAYLPQLILR